MNYLNLWNDYTVTENDMKKNIERIHEKMPFRPRFSKKSKGVNLRSLLHLDQKFEIYITKFLINKKIDQ
ncbi:hypothetical protein P689_119189 [Candidatus Riesia pediculischaeffi PTSU]|uniref:Uncharacterized protein n=1 Tax=Candidatus Riesia pediculischaeffi PTSU TaxID=1401651 RepID=A0A0C1V8Q3_9ENTR|nr:hypothetical protein P689_119189 [Candidatus Riesia pediculischaeffi PTSU]